MLRVFFTISAAFSLLLCIAALVMWPLSHSYITGVGVTVAASRAVGWETHRGWIVFDVSPAGENDWFAYHDGPDVTFRMSIIDYLDNQRPGGFLTLDIRSIRLPLWLVGLIAAILPAIWFWRFIGRSRRRRLAGACAQCGYDLRGNPAASACPECGALKATSDIVYAVD